MPSYDPSTDRYVLKVAFDGPSRAGKTSSLRAFAAKVGNQTWTPAEELGRTLYFDWSTHVGGSVDGRSLECRMLTVPGQPEYKDRRRHLLLEADCVIFVVEGTKAALEDARSAVEEARAWCAEREPVVPVLVQVNKHDLHGAMSHADICEHLEIPTVGMPIVSTSARTGLGISEVCAFAVRAGLNRLRAAQRRGDLPRATTNQEAREALLRSLKELDFEERRGPHRPAAELSSILTDSSRVNTVWPTEARRTLSSILLRPLDRHQQGATGYLEQRGPWRLFVADQDRSLTRDEATRRVARLSERFTWTRDRLEDSRFLVISEVPGDAQRCLLWQIGRS